MKPSRLGFGALVGIMSALIIAGLVQQMLKTGPLVLVFVALFGGFAALVATTAHFYMQGK